MQQDTNKSIEYVHEHDLQAVTGGCSGCYASGSLAHKQAGEASANATRLLQSDISAANAEKLRANQLTQIAVDAQNNAKKAPIPGCAHCEGYPKIVNQVAPLLRL
jgi:hypothetical protein